MCKQQVVLKEKSRERINAALEPVWVPDAEK